MMLQTKFEQKIKNCFFLRKSYLYETMWKNKVESASPHITM